MNYRHKIISKLNKKAQTIPPQNWDWDKDKKVRMGKGDLTPAEGPPEALKHISESGMQDVMFEWHGNTGEGPLIKVVGHIRGQEAEAIANFVGLQKS